MRKGRLTSKRVDTARPPGAHSMAGDRPTTFPQATEARPITGKWLSDELTPQATRRVRGPSCHRQMAHRRVVSPSNTCRTGLRGMTYYRQMAHRRVDFGPAKTIPNWCPNRHDRTGGRRAPKTRTPGEPGQDITKTSADQSHQARNPVDHKGRRRARAGDRATPQRPSRDTPTEHHMPGTRVSFVNARPRGLVKKRTESERPDTPPPPRTDLVVATPSTENFTAAKRGDDAQPHS